MTDSSRQMMAQKVVSDFSPKLVSLTDDVPFGGVWVRPDLPPRDDRSLNTVAALVAGETRSNCGAISHWRKSTDSPKPS